MRRLRLAFAQINVTVGDLDHNVSTIIDNLKAAEAEDADLVAFPELVITGYPPEDLLLKGGFVEDNREALDRVAAEVGDVVALVGFVDTDADNDCRYNALAVCHRGEVRGVYRKRRLPNYQVFDEQRYFTAGSEPLQLYEVAGVKVGVSVCEDAWWPGGPIVEQAEGGAELVININASPYHAGKVRTREATLAARADEACCYLGYVNLVGGQDELVFDGASLVVSPDGDVITRAAQYTEGLFVTDVEIGPTGDGVRRQPLPVVQLTTESTASGPVLIKEAAAPLDPLPEIYGALVTGTRDYVHKTGFTDVVLGLSGGIDSSLVAAIAVDALGAEHVHGVLMPSRYSTSHSVTDAEALAENLGIDHRTVVIEPAFRALLEMLAPSFGEMPHDLTEENLQPRVRGMVLMALSNKFGWLVLTTGNKSEMAVGYATLYGDMAGGFAVIKDVPKTTVFALCRDLNERAGRELIPTNVITKLPSAELRPDQYDTDSLPDYAVLDPILEAYIEKDQTAGELIEQGFDAELVRRVVRLVDLAEYKRRQAPPGVRVTTKAFGKDRRLPITNRYRG
jgi:NAD+ synthase (glutamine-hydrolysing)